MAIDDTIHEKMMKRDTVIAANIRKQKNDLFSTEATVGAVLDKYNVTGENVTVVMVTVNSVLEAIARGVDDGRYSSP